MPAPRKNQNAAKPARLKVNAAKEVRGLPAEKQAWERAQKKAGLKWNDWGRLALNEKAGVKTSSTTEGTP